MNNYGLILVEGLTGCGKSSLAHFISRQLEANGIPNTWVHEGEAPHPIFPAEELPVEEFIAQMPARWETFLEDTREAGKIAVVEACYFNNMIEEPFKENLPRDEVIAFGMRIQEVIRPFNPALIYLSRGPVPEALEINFADRGEGFKDFVIELTTKTAYARENKLGGYQGMVRFWEDAVSIYQQLFETYTIDKLLVDNRGPDWPGANQQVLDFLQIPYHPEPQLAKAQAMTYLGSYQLKSGGETWRVWYDDQLGSLRLNKFILLPTEGQVFLINSHHFEVHFQTDPEGKISGFEIKGRDIDYLKLVGIEGIKLS